MNTRGPRKDREYVCAREGCDRTFLARSSSQRYCSDRCRRIARFGEQTCAWPKCGKAFVPTRACQRYCSRQCAGKAASNRASWGACSYCGETITDGRCRDYCSQECKDRDEALATPGASWKGASIMRLPDTALTQWGWKRDPFADEPRDFSELFWSHSHEQVRARIVQTIRHNDALAISADIGWGKTFLWLAIKDELEQEAAMSYIFIEPAALAKHRISANSLQTAILADADRAPERVLSSEGLSRQVQTVLKSRALNRNTRIVLFVDEAHRLQDDALRALKNLLDVKSGLQRVLSIVLMGQLELMTVLGKVSVAEVAARIKLRRPAPLSVEDGELRGYVRHRVGLAVLGRAPLADESIPSPFSDDAMAAIEAELSSADEHAPAGSEPTYQAINSICSHCLELAVLNGLDTVDADVVARARSRMRGGL